MNSDSLQQSNQNFVAELANTLVAGLAVSFVAISLGAAFGILSTRGAFAGILSAGIIALITGLFGGTRIQTSGPTAPMTAVIVLVVAFAACRMTSTPQIAIRMIKFFIVIRLLLPGRFPRQGLLLLQRVSRAEPHPAACTVV